MPSAMTTSGGTANGTSPAQGQPQAAIAAKSFVRASMEHRESAGIDVQRAITASDQDLGSFPIPAYGYIRSLLLYVTVSGGAGTAAFQKDAPWNILKNIIIQEPNGATIAQFNSGYDLFLANKWGGYRYANDPKTKFDYNTNVTGGSISFMLRIPLELRGRDGLGSLPNQNAAAAFQLRATLSSAATVYSTNPTTLPNVRLRVVAEEWDQPAVSSDGSPNQTTPPAMNTTQYWTKQIYPVSVGQNTIRLTRVGNYLREVIFIYRDATNARVSYASNNWPSPAVLYYDTRPTDNVLDVVWRGTMQERTGYIASTVDSANGLDDGVFVYDYAHEFDGSIGYELNDGWLPTLSSTRLEIQGTFGVAGTLEVLTNDVSVAGNVFIN
ncbi:major capsid protein [Rhodococcus phage P19]|nr:major capsid protein [Rhodococcus phage P19]